MSIFGHPPTDDELKRLIDEQKAVSDETLAYIERVVRRKDELLAAAVNQTAEAVREQKRRKGD